MASDETKRLKPKLLTADEDSYEAWQAIANYRPNNADYAADLVKTHYQALQALQAAETQAEAAYKAARDNAVKGEWDFHNLMLGVKDQVASQFGRDSNELQALGLKKKSERKAPTRKSKTA